MLDRKGIALVDLRALIATLGTSLLACGGISESLSPRTDAGATCDAGTTFYNGECVPLDGVPPTPNEDAASEGTCTAPPDIPAYDGGYSVGCTAVASNECRPGEYTMFCIVSIVGQPTPPSRPTPPASLQCQVDPVPGPAGTELYCCPCQ
jgi:hypothetical protein